MNTLPQRIERAAQGDRTVTFVDGDDHVTLPWAQLHDEARAMAAALQQRGVVVGDHVALLGPTTRSLVTAIQATWLSGAVLVMLPLPMRMGSLEQFVAQTRARIRAADVSMVLVDPQLAAFVEPTDGDPPFAGFAELEPPASGVGSADFVAPSVDPDALAVLQFTSGSTSEPKGVMLTHRQICANVDGCYQAAEMTDDDVVVSWLPLYHDMGLIGLLTIPMTSGCGLVQGAPQDFLGKPSRWMGWMSDFGGTITAGPNFSYVLATRSLRRAEDLDLSRVRIVLNGAEPVDADAFRRFFAEGERFGLRIDAAFPAFGMAELCIGGTFPRPGAGLCTDVVDGRVLEGEHYAAPVEPGAPNARELVFLGRAVPGLQLRVVHPDTGELCADREVGELQIRGTSLMAGYYRRPEESADLLVDGWLRTGDLAYLVDGEMVMCGRIKDVIIIGGRNIYPQDVERAVGEVEGVRAGNVIAFGESGRYSKQHIVVVAETRVEDGAELVREISRAVTEEVGVPPRDVVLVPPGTVPKTSSGKLQRTACRKLFESGELGGTVAAPPVELVEPPAAGAPAAAPEPADEPVSRRP